MFWVVDKAFLIKQNTTAWFGYILQKKKKILAWKVSLMVTPKNQENMCFTLSSLKREDFIGDMGSS